MRPRNQVVYRVAWIQGQHNPCARMHGDDLPAASADFEQIVNDPYVRTAKLEQYQETGQFTIRYDGSKVEPTYTRQILRRWRREEAAPAPQVLPELSLFALRQALVEYDVARTKSGGAGAKALLRLRDLLERHGVGLHLDT